MSISWSGNATTLFNLAKFAVQQIAKKEPPERHPSHGEAIFAIVFSAMTLEAFINEAADIAAFPAPSGHPAHHPSVVMFAAIAKELRGSKISVRAKFLLARLVFAGQPYDKGSLPYQDFHLLIGLRNTLVHMEGLDITETTPAGEVIANQPEIIEKLRTRGILAEPTLTGLWMERIATLETARWACNTVTAMYQSLVDVIPDEDFKNRLASSYGFYFQPVH